MSNLNNNYNNNNNNNKNLYDSELTEILHDERFIFGNFGGYVKKPYIKYCNLVVLEMICIIFFAIIYYPMLLHYDNILFKIDNVPKYGYIVMAWRAILHSINFQANADYTPIHFKHIVPQTIVTLQLVVSMLLAFLFLTV